MAGDWIKVEKATARKDEIYGIAGRLGISLDNAFGLCVRFWIWCDDQLKDGNAKFVTPALLNHDLGVTGFAEALIEVGWLQVRSGSLVVPHFDRHLSASAKNRAETNRRVSESRKRKCNEFSLQKPLPEKRREEKSNKEIPPNPIGGGKEFHEAQAFINRWNMTDGVVLCRSVSPKRIKSFAARCRDKTWDWESALAKFPLKCFDGRGWKPQVDWFLRPDSVLKILEGNYDWTRETSVSEPDKPRACTSAELRSLTASDIQGGKHE